MTGACSSVWLERTPDKREVDGSTPSRPTNDSQRWGCSSVGRAPALHAGGHRFEPVHLHHLWSVPSKHWLSSNRQITSDYSRTRDDYHQFNLFYLFFDNLDMSVWKRSIQLCWQFCDQVSKGRRWMPWRQEAMKDVASCDKLRGAAKQALIRRFLNGETRLG